MTESNKVWLGVLGGVLLGAFGAAVIKRGNLRGGATKALSYGYDLKDRIVEQCETFKEDCEDLAAEAKEQYEDRKEAKTKEASAPAKKPVRRNSRTAQKQA